MDTRNFKDSTKAAAAYLAEQGIDVPHTRLLEALSRAFGERNWSTLSAQLQELKSPKQPAPAQAAPDVPAWDPSQGPMSEAQYVAHRGCRCPYCGSKEVSADSVDADGDTAWDENTCGTCRSTWKSSYQLSGYFEGETGKPAVPPVQCIMLQQPGIFTTNLEGFAFEVEKALPILAKMADENPADYSVEELLALVTVDEVRCITVLKQHGIAHVSRAVRRWPWEVRFALWEDLRRENKVLLAGRESVIEDIVEYVRDRARTYQFALHTWTDAYDNAVESSEALGLDASKAEILEAASRLI